MTQLPNFLVTTVEADTICHSTAQPQFIQRQINLLAYAKQAEKDGHPGARKWIELNEPKHERWKNIKAFLEDESIPSHTMFTLSDPTEQHQTKVGFAYSVRELEQ